MELKLPRKVLAIMAAALITLALPYAAFADTLSIRGNEYEITGASKGYVRGPGEYSVVAKEGYYVSLEELDGYSEAISINVLDDGSNTPFYVMDSSGNVSESITNAVRIDSTAPIITGVSTTAVTDDVYLKEHGIYSSDDIELLLNVTAEDTESGIEKITLVGTNESGEETKYEGGNVAKTSSGIRSTFVIPSRDEMLKETLKVYAEDAVGNVSALTLVRGTEEESTVTIESVLPTISPLTGEGQSINGWFSEPPVIKADISDSGSGIAGIKYVLNGEEVYSREFSDKRDSHQLSSYIIGDKERSEVESYIKAHEDECNGVFALTIIVTDNSGNMASRSETFNISLKEPVVEISGVDEGAFVKSVDSIKVDADDIHSGSSNFKLNVTVEKDGSQILEEEVSGVGTYSIPGSTFEEDGNYKVRASATSVSGKTSKEAVRNFTKDSTDPDINIGSPSVSPNENGWINKPFSVPFDASDKVAGMQDLRAYINDRPVSYTGEYLKYSVNFSESIIESLSNTDGTYTLRIEGTDKAGNVTSRSITLKVDTEAPSASIAGIKEGAFLKEAVPLTLSSNDLFSEKEGNMYDVTITKDGSVIFNESIKAGASTVINKEKIKENGKYVVTYRAIDPAGNSSEQKKLSFVIDNIKPGLNIESVAKHLNENGWANKPMNFSFTTDDSISGLKEVKAYINDKEVKFSNSKSIYEVALTKNIIESLIRGSGRYTLKVVSKDMAGNTSEEEKSILLDIVKPSLSISGVDNDAFYQEERAVTLSSDDANAKKKGNKYIVKIKRNGETEYDKEVAGDEEIKVAKSHFSKDGKYVLSAKTVDPAGNSSGEKTISFVKDNTKPELNFTSISGSKKNKYGWYNSSLAYKFHLYDETAKLKSYDVTINGENVPHEKNGSTVSVPLTRELISKLINDKGTYRLSVLATDKAGNEARMTKVIKVDIVTPKLTLSSIETGKHYKASPSLSISTSEKFYMMKGAYISVRVVRDGKEVLNRKYEDTNEFSFSSFAHDGDYEVYVSEVDAAGNEAKEVKEAFMKDSTAPSISIENVSEGKFYDHAVNPKVVVKERYYKENKVEIKMTRKLHGKTEDVPFSFKSSGETSSVSKEVSKTGEYHIKVTATDEAGNTAEEKDISFKVDTEEPVLKIEEVKNNEIYGFDDKVAPVITYKDDYFDKVEYSIKRADKDWKKKLVISEEKGKISIADVKKKKANDGNYVIFASVTDKAGNVSKKTVNFSINRYGSAFRYSDDIKEFKDAYVKNVDTNMHVEELNVSKISKTRNIITRDGEVISETSDYKEKAREKGYRVYEHLFDSGHMTEEGVYTINVISKDKAGNEMESAKDAGDVRFVVDRTKPTISVTGLEKKVNKGKNLTFTVNAVDSLSPVDTTVSVNGEPLLAQGGEGANVFHLPSGMNQEVIITSEDKAGNISILKKNVSVTESGFLYFFNSFGLPLLLGSLVISGIVAAIVLYVKRPKPAHGA